MTRIETIADGVTLYLADYRDVIPMLPEVDAVVTSPPYAAQRQYITFNGDKYESLLGPIADIP